VLLTTYFFTKLTEVVGLKNMTYKEVIESIAEHIIQMFGISQILTMDHGISFMSKEVREFSELYKIKLFNSSLYYAQTNGHAEFSNKILISLC
jgi:hypothetical protein